MVKKLVVPLLLLIFVSFWSGCQKSPINGDLDGKWQILEIEYKNETFPVKDKQLYYNFSLHVCNLSYYGGSFTDGNLTFINNKIYLNFPYILSSEGLSRLNQYGIYSNPVEFKVEFLDKKKLIMKEDDNNIIITLRKF